MVVMKTKEPTMEQVAKFWSHFGFKWIKPLASVGELDDIQKALALENWEYPDGTRYFWDYTTKSRTDYAGGLPTISLNSLFKWAVPKLDLVPYQHQVNFLLMDGSYEAMLGNDWSSERFVCREDGDPALALFWAIWDGEELDVQDKR